MVWEKRRVWAPGYDAPRYGRTYTAIGIATLRDMNNGNRGTKEAMSGRCLRNGRAKKPKPCCQNKSNCTAKAGR